MKKNWLTGLTVLAAALMLVLFSTCDLLNGKEDEKATIPATPTGVRAGEAPGEGIQITWDWATGVDKYIIYRFTGASNSPLELGANVSGSASSYIDGSGLVGTNYSYAVAARNSQGTSEKSSKTIAVPFPLKTGERPLTPTGIEAVVQGPDAILITWVDAANAPGYKVYRSTTENGIYTVVAGNGTLLNEKTYLDNSGLSASTEYFYKVVSVIGGVESDRSGFAKGTTSSAGSVAPNYNSIDITDYSTGNYAFLVKNVGVGNTELVAFKGTPAPDTIIGRVPAGAYTHGINRDPAKFTSTTGFALTLLTEAEYNAKKTLLGTATAYAKIYVFYNHTGTNEKVYEINAHGNTGYSIKLQNRRSMNVELRRNGINGTPIGFAPDGVAETEFYVDTGDYQLYPVFIKYNTTRGELVTVYPKFANGDAVTNLIGVSYTSQHPIFDLESLLTSDYTFSTGTAYLIIDNRTDGTGVGVQVKKGPDIQYSAEGVSTINGTQTHIIPLFMTKVGVNYASSESITGYTIGQTGYSYPIPAGTGAMSPEVVDVNNQPLPEIVGSNLQVDKVYRVVVRGSNITNLVVYPPVLEGSVSLEDFPTE
ncbi:hypothetical protein AGMMS50267_09950 [Spirochaetia bacterium]|nr:hypothetical protein AGMMS50267_09950 [Spirochaetia bacterium]